MRRAAEVIKDGYRFYDEDNAQKDIGLCGEQIQELMKQYAKEVLQEAAELCREIEDGRFEHFTSITALIDLIQ